jgi:hypothetical protein
MQAPPASPDLQRPMSRYASSEAQPISSFPTETADALAAGPSSFTPANVALMAK